MRVQMTDSLNRTDFKNILIRPARPADNADLLRLIRAYYRFDRIRFRAAPISIGLKRLLERRSLGRVWIMSDGLRPAGYLILTYNFDLEFGGLEGIITDLFIAEKYRGLRLGERAVEVASEYCRTHGIGAIELQVESANRAAQEFYRKIGFRRLSRLVMLRETSTVAGSPTRGRRGRSG